MQLLIRTLGMTPQIVDVVDHPTFMAAIPEVLKEGYALLAVANPGPDKKPATTVFAVVQKDRLTGAVTCINDSMKLIREALRFAAFPGERGADLAPHEAYLDFFVPATSTFHHRVVAMDDPSSVAQQLNSFLLYGDIV